MKNIGKYNGILCYECTHKEYVNVYNSNFDNGKQIFIIDGIMVKQNVIIGKYDGQRVKDLYDGQVYYRNDDVMDFNKQKQASFTADNSKWNKKFSEEVKTKQEGQMTETVVVSYEDLVKQDIDFGKYSTVVDEFFALLEA